MPITVTQGSDTPMTLLLALDIGTSKICALALDAGTLSPIATRSFPSDAEVPGLPAGRHEQGPVRILATCEAALRAVLSESGVRAADVAGIGISGQMHGVLLLDKARGIPVTNLITWRDQRTVELGDAENDIEAACALLGEDAPDRMGCHLHPGYGGATLFWLSRRKMVPAGAIALTIADYIAFSLTGVAATEPTHAASWGILDARRCEWDQRAVTALGIMDGALPPVRPSSRPVGTLLPKYTSLLGLPAHTPVCSPLGDNQASVIGAAGLGSGAAVANLGTGGQISLPIADWSYCEGMETRPMPFDGYLLVGSSLCGGWAYAYLRQFFQSVAREFAGKDLDDRQVYERMNRLASEAARGASGIRADSRFAGTRGNPATRGGFESIDTRNLTPSNLCRAILEGMVRELAEMPPPELMRNIKRVVAGGNAVRENPLLLQIMRDFFGVPCAQGTAREEAALGAAYAAGVGLNVLSVADLQRAAEAQP
jgi:sugar (pentulose or hexulose) kinase